MNIAKGKDMHILTHYLTTQVYLVEFFNGSIADSTTYVNAENIYLQIDVKGRLYLIFKEHMENRKELGIVLETKINNGYLQNNLEILKHMRQCLCSFIWSIIWH